MEIIFKVEGKQVDNPGNYVLGGKSSIEDLKDELLYELEELSKIDGVIEVHIEKVLDNKASLRVRGIEPDIIELIMNKLGKQRFI